MESEKPLHRLERPWLSEQGVAEAKACGRKLKEQALSFDIAFTSV